MKHRDAFAKIGRQQVIDQIETLEHTPFDCHPMFAFCGSFEEDIEAAAMLRNKYDIPRTKSRQLMIDELFERRDAIMAKQQQPVSYDFVEIILLVKIAVIIIGVLLSAIVVKELL